MEAVNAETKEIAPVRREMPNLAPRNFAEAMEFAKMLEQSAFVPKEFKGRAGDILAAIQFGFELGVGPMQALQNIAVINGKPSVYGDLALALVQASGKLAYHHESDDGSVATCIVRRVGEDENHAVTFSDDDAKVAALLDKAGPWKQYRKRMRMFRARGFALRDKFADVLKGIITREEAEDYPAPIETRRMALPAPVPAEDINQSAETPTRDENTISTPEERAMIIKLADDARGPEKGKEWCNRWLASHEIKKWGDVTVGHIVTMTKELADPAESFQLSGEPA